MSDINPKTDDERARVKELNDWSRMPLAELLKKKGGSYGNDGSDGHGPPSGIDLSGAVPSSDQILQEEVCAADGIVTATIRQRKTFVTETATWLVTDYVVSVDTWIRNNSKLQTSELTLSDSGGEIDVAGAVIRVMNGPVPLFTLNQRYLIFFRRLQKSEGFRVVKKPPLILGSNPKQDVSNQSVIKVTTAAANCRQR